MDKTALTHDDATQAAPPRASLLQRLILRFATLESFGVRDFRWMWLSTLLSMMAMGMQMMTRVWLVLRLMDDSPMAVVYITMTFALPMMLVSLVGGALADRIPRKRLMMAAQGGNAILTLVVATLDFTGLISFWHLMVVGVANGSLMAINMPSRQAILSDILPEDKLMNGIALQNSAMNLTRILGPAVAGLLIIFLGTAGVFYIVAVAYVLSVLAVSMIDAGVEAKSRSGKGMGGDIKAGFAYAAGNPVLLGLLIMSFVPVLFGMSYYVLMPAWAREVLDVESDGLGILNAAMGVGALVGSLMVASLGRFRKRGALLLAVCVAWGVLLAAFSQSTSYQVAVAVLVLVGLASAVYMSLNMTMLQLYSSPEMRGRIMSIAMMTFGLMPLSAIPFGIVAESRGTPDALLLSGVLLVAFTLLFTFAYPRFRRIAQVKASLPAQANRGMPGRPNAPPVARSSHYHLGEQPCPAAH